MSRPKAIKSSGDRLTSVRWRGCMVTAVISRVLATVVVLMAAACGNADEGEDAPPGPGLAIPADEADTEWFLLDSRDWPLKTAGIAAEGAIAPPRGLWFAHYEQFPRPNFSRSLALSLHDSDGKSAREFADQIPSGGPSREAGVVGGEQAYFVPYSDEPNSGGWLYWSISDSRVLALGGNEVPQKELERLALSLVSLNEGEWRERTATARAESAETG